MITTEVLFVTPAMALEMLKASGVNRKTRERVVLAYRRDMEAGRWRMTGEPIQFTKSGDLANGKHRLTALSEADIEGIYLLVVRGLENDAQEMMDQGAVRSAKDALSLKYGDVKDLSLISSLARWMAAAPEPGPEMLAALKAKVSTAATLQAYSDNPDITPAVANGHRMYGSLRVSPTALGYSWLHLNRVDTEACELFFYGMSEMSFYDENDPRKAALRRLQMINLDRDAKAGNRTGVGVVSVITRTWNMWRKGEPCRSITFNGPNGTVIAPVRPI
jgi:hypothetical protein